MSEIQIGSAPYRYRVNTDWARLPDGYRFGTTHGVVEDAAGRIYVHHTGSPSTFVFEPDGTFVSAWGEAYAVGAHGMHLNRENGDEFLYLAATSLGFVAKTTLDGEELLRIATPPRPDIYDDEHRFVPTETTVAPDGTIFIADGYGQPSVHRYTRGETPRILVSDRKNVRLQYFDLEGKHLGVVQGMLRFPCTTIQWNDHLYIPDLHSRLTVLGPDDTLVAHLADWPDCWKRPGWPNLPRSEWIAGRVSSPHDLHVDAGGSIYLAEWLSEGAGKVTKFEGVR
jgi:hypothetical protein